MKASLTYCCLAMTVSFVTASLEALPWNLPFTSSSEPLIGYPGVLSRDYVHMVVQREMRNQLSSWTNTAHTRKGKRVPKSGGLRQRQLKKSSRDSKDSKDDLSGLNDILESLEFDIPEQVIEQPFLGATATFVLAGKCGDIEVKDIDLEYESKRDDLTYRVEIEDVEVMCAIDIEFDFGIYDVEDELKVRVKLGDTDFALGVVLEGIPPDSSSFEGCKADINIKDIDAEGGFSANILNDLDGQLVALVEAEKPLISQLLCEQLTQFTSVVDGILFTLTEAIEPYLGEPKSVNPLRLEKQLDINEELVDFTDSDLGYAIEVIAENLDGVIGPYQINTLIELNLLDEDAIFTVDLTEAEEDRARSLQSEECPLFRRRSRNLLGMLMSDALVGRRMQLDDGFFAVNSLDILKIEVAGLNTFDDVDLLEIIGKYTFRSKLEVSRIKIKVTIKLSAAINEEILEEIIEVTLPIEDIEITASYLVGLSAAAVEDIQLSSLLASDNLEPCLLSTLRAFGLSELDVEVGEIGSPIIDGALSSGVDNLINTALEAAIHHYQDLIVEEAIPNIAQKNVTAVVNDFAECFIRTEAATAVCPEPEQTEDGTIITGLFDFRKLAERLSLKVMRNH